jgi:hypothetical protein
MPSVAFADSGEGSGSALTNSKEGAALRAWRKTQQKGNGHPSSRTSSRRTRTNQSYEQQLRSTERQTEKYVAYSARKQAYEACTSAGQAGCKAPGDPVDLPDGIARGQIQGAPQITPQQAAIVAVARLHLDPPKPVIGPSPDVNEWHMAAVGYPYWLWAEGNLDPAPVSTTVADLTVRLDAHLASTTFDLGDGTRVTCTDLTARWTPAVEPAAPSPACGHTYTKPSLPKGRYRITAYSTWAVDWSVNGVGGTIPLYQQASTTVPVGELQVLTH